VLQRQAKSDGLLVQETMMQGTDIDVATIPEAYHLWYYEQKLWEQVTWQGVPCLKSVSDLWNYQEIIFAQKPSLIVEFGTRHGGSALFFANVGCLARPDCRVFTVDTDHTDLDRAVLAQPAIHARLGSSTDPAVLGEVRALRETLGGPVFAILDSDHRREHVLREMEGLRDILAPGDYLVVEDSNINGHPVLPGWGEGPWEAIEEYTLRHPGDYERDVEREFRFGFTFAPRGFLIRR
jgi:cephalosporin hydroxylase